MEENKTTQQQLEELAQARKMDTEDPVQKLEQLKQLLWQLATGSNGRNRYEVSVLWIWRE